MNDISEELFEQDMECLIDEVVLTGQPLMIRRDGTDVAVLASYEEWQHILDGWVTIEVEWDDDTLKKIRQMAIAKNSTVPNIIREALTEFLDKMELEHFADIEAREERCI